MQVFISSSTDPWCNLATEEWLFQNNDLPTPILFLWRNREAVIIGRFQNPWAECNLDYTRQEGIAVLRRQSGGGAVFHDPGNTNFSIISDIASHDRDAADRLVASALKEFGISAEISPHHDLFVDGHKISGSAARESKTRGLHHGTLLIDVDRKRLTKALSPRKRRILTKGVASRPASICNLGDLVPAMDHDAVCGAIQNAFFTHHNRSTAPVFVDLEELEQDQAYRDSLKKLQSWEWIYGSSPAFSSKFLGGFQWGMVEMQVRVESGVIKSVFLLPTTLTSELRTLSRLLGALPGVKFRSEEITEALQKFPGDIPKDIASWISEGV